MTNLVVTDTALLLPTVQAVLERLHTLADTNDDAIIQQVLGSGHDWKSASAEQNSAPFRDALLPSRDNGRFLYGVARSISARHIVEFGTSYGVSTIYFAAALRDNGGGLVVGSELESCNVAQADQNLAEAGLAELVEIRTGDALQALQTAEDSIDLLFLNG